MVGGPDLAGGAAGRPSRTAAAEAAAVGADGGPGILREADNIAAETVGPAPESIGRAVGLGFIR